MVNERSTKWGFLLYPDDDSHMNTLDMLQKSDGVSLSLSFILHDKDVYREDIKDKDGNILHYAGEIKKPHYHVVACFPNQVWKLAVCKEFFVEPNYIQRIRNYDNALLYLVHFRDPDKFNYSIDEVHGTLTQKLREIMSKEGKSESERVIEVLAYIESCGYLRYIDLCIWCASNGYWDVYRRSASHFANALSEHNYFYSHANSDLSNNDVNNNNFNNN